MGHVLCRSHLLPITAPLTLFGPLLYSFEVRCAPGAHHLDFKVIRNFKFKFSILVKKIRVFVE